MQVQVNKEQPKFQPVHLSITFESETELQAFKTMCDFNYSVADKVFEQNIKSRDHQAFDKEVLAIILSKIYDKF